MSGISVIWVIICILVVLKIIKQSRKISDETPQMQFTRPDQNRQKDAERLKSVYNLTLAAPLVPGASISMKGNFGDYRILISSSEKKLIYDVKFTGPLDFEGCMIRGNTGMISQLLKGHPVWGSSKIFGEAVTPFACSANTQKDLERFVEPPIRTEAILELIDQFPEIIINPSGVHVMDQSFVPSVKILDFICERMEAIEFPDKDAKPNTAKAAEASADEKRFAPISVPSEQDMNQERQEEFAGLSATAPKRFAPIAVPPVNTQENKAKDEVKPEMPKPEMTATPIQEIKPVQEVKPGNVPSSGPAGNKAVSIDETLSVQSVAEKLFAETFTGSTAEKKFAEFAGKRVRWRGKLVTIMPFSMDFVFRGKKGVKATFEIYEMKGKFGGTIKIKAIAAFPTEVQASLNAARNQVVTVEGTLLKFESFMHEIYMDDAIFHES